MPRKEASLCFLLACCREAAARPCSLRQASFCGVLISFTTVVVEGCGAFSSVFKKKFRVFLFAFPQRIRICLRTGLSIDGYYGAKVKKV